MKKILLNGCSFTAGDAVSWDKHHPDIDWNKYIFNKKLHPTYSSKQISSFMHEYTTTLRQTDNLKGQLTNLLNTTVVDISMDGNSNDNIALATIGFLSKLSPEEQREYHVCVGWTELTRRVRWLHDTNNFFNIHVYHINLEERKYEHPFIKEVIVNSHEFDHLVNYLTNIIMLESYLKANGISYTFWKSLGLCYDRNSIYHPKSVHDNASKYSFFTYNNVIEPNHWLTFDDEPMPWLGTPWVDVLSETKSFIDRHNHHPNLDAVKKLSVQLANQISQ